MYLSFEATYQNARANPGENDPNDTTLGEVHVKIPNNKNCGFVQYANRTSAEQALSVLNDTILGRRNVRLSWGHSPSSKQGQPDQAVSIEETPKSPTNLTVNLLPEDSVPPLLIC
ncbi:hypothetical protein COLO4_13223 [Corchorus olitorius]|uniref:RRM domain-containing protein n=1 Tax=Corchorus olitorius TaxID=93759 RepID=A0A1R3JXI5_9ROSI|nr:hypothetical protein COLO4_13223 [Corchorus olitorius]